MDGSLMVSTVMAELEATALNATTWTEVRVAVRAWAAKHCLLPCTTTPVSDGLEIAYYDEIEGCKKYKVCLPTRIANNYILEFEKNRSDW